MSELTRRQFVQAVAGGAALTATARNLEAMQNSSGPAATPSVRNIKWAYMDHWSILSPRGRTSPYLSLEQMDRYIRQIALLGFTGFDTFNFRLGMLSGMFGSLSKFQDFLRERGF